MLTPPRPPASTWHQNRLCHRAGGGGRPLAAKHWKCLRYCHCGSFSWDPVEARPGLGVPSRCRCTFWGQGIQENFLWMFSVLRFLTLQTRGNRRASHPKARVWDPLLRGGCGHCLTGPTEDWRRGADCPARPGGSWAPALCAHRWRPPPPGAHAAGGHGVGTGGLTPLSAWDVARCPQRGNTTSRVVKTLCSGL